MAYAFNGSTQYLTTVSSAVSSLPITIAAWFYSTSNSARQNIASPNTNDGVSNYTLAMLEFDGSAAGDPLRATYRMGGTTGPANAQSASSSVSVSINQWNQGLAVLTSSTSRTVYLNGGNSSTNTTDAGATAPNFDLMSIGNLYRNASALPFFGNIAEVAIWKVALTADEATGLGKGFKPTRIRPQSLVFYAPLIRSLQDPRGGLAITNNNSATVADHPRVY